VELRGSDFLVGLFVLGSIGVIVGVIILTSGIGMARYDLYVRAATAADLTTDTRVLLQGLQVGRVRAISPALDSAGGTVSVVARLAMDRRFPDGTTLELPAGTRAVIVQRSPITAPAIQLELPAGPATAFLAHGDTISAERPAGVLDALGEAAAELRGELTATLADTRALLVRTTRAVEQTQGLLAATQAPLVATLEELRSALHRTDALLADLSPRLIGLGDSVALALSDTRRLLHSLDSLTTVGFAMATENRDNIRFTIEHLHRAANVLEHFTDRVSRRPLRLFTGVTPPPDTLHPEP
jgi:ABC-type transporter Mla subunit MlaD